MWLPHDVGMESDAENGRATIAFAQQLLDGIVDHASEGRRLLMASDDRGDVVDLLRIGNGENALAAAGLQPCGLIVMRPVEHIIETGFLK